MEARPAAQPARISEQEISASPRKTAEYRRNN
jgi:hypothetical protein